MAILEKDLTELARLTNGKVPFGLDNIDPYDLDEDGIEYPEGDGKPMAETDEHRAVMVEAIFAVESLLEGRADVYISGNNCVYYERGNNQKFVSPDCYVVINVTRQPIRPRRVYRIWQEDGNVPAFVLETTSRKTRREDVNFKGPLYERLGVLEYFRFDPTGDYLNPRLQGSRLVDGIYIAMEMVNGRLVSEVLNAYLTIEGTMLRFISRTTGMPVRTIKETKQRADDAAQLEAENERLKAIIAAFESKVEGSS